MMMKRVCFLFENKYDKEDCAPYGEILTPELCRHPLPNLTCKPMQLLSDIKKKKALFSVPFQKIMLCLV